jgi:NTP pyrophosphatase (non-canonical NTP hydrolase)
MKFECGLCGDLIDGETDPDEHLRCDGNDIDFYQRSAMRTVNPVTDFSATLAINALGIAGEAGEVADYVKKVVGHGHSLDKEVLKEELGDVLWYIAVMADMLGMKLSDVADANIAKLRERYPDGFSSERSVNRQKQRGGGQAGVENKEKRT